MSQIQNETARQRNQIRHGVNPNGFLKQTALLQWSVRAHHEVGAPMFRQLLRLRQVMFQNQRPRAEKSVRFLESALGQWKDLNENTCCESTVQRRMFSKIQCQLHACNAAAWELVRVHATPLCWLCEAAARELVRVQELLAPLSCKSNQYMPSLFDAVAYDDDDICPACRLSRACCRPYICVHTTCSYTYRNAHTHTHT